MSTDDSSETEWATDELAEIDTTDEIEVSTRRSDGTLRSPRIVWVVRHGDSFYVRSVHGQEAAWYRGVQSRHTGVVTARALLRDVHFVEVGDHVGDDTELDDSLDQAYRSKYGRWPGPVDRITAQSARATTLRLDPA